MPRATVDFTGQRFTRWTVLSFARTAKQGVVWRCQCDCGVEREVNAKSLRNGSSKSCGCFSVDVLRARSTTHGMSNSSEFGIWTDILTRCTNPNREVYADYGGRGITVCERWKDSFENFYADMGPRPSKKHSVDRRNNDLGYSPDNCCWATMREQTRNKRNNIWVCWDDHVEILSDAARYFRIPDRLVRRRLSRGWSMSDSLTRPVDATAGRFQRKAA